MNKQRLEAFSDGVIAIIITIMVLELKVPHGASLADLVPLIPIFVGYVLSFVFVAIYWNNHHHMLQATQKVDGKILWANTHLLFWLSLIPFTTGWMGEHAMAATPVVLYGINLLCCAISYTILSKLLVSHHGPESHLANALGSDTKGFVSLALYIIGVITAFWWPIIAYIIYATVALIWLIPDRRIEKALEKS